MALVRALLQEDKPNMESLTVVGRLFSRYTGVAGNSPAAEILEGLNECLYKWDMTRSELNTACFKIWNSVGDLGSSKTNSPLARGLPNG